MLVNSSIASMLAFIMNAMNAMNAMNERGAQIARLLGKAYANLKYSESLAELRADLSGRWDEGKLPDSGMLRSSDSRERTRVLSSKARGLLDDDELKGVDDGTEDW